MAITPAELCDIEEIKQLKARYFRYVDTRQWVRLRALFVDDARIDMRLPFANPDAYIANFSSKQQPRITCHHGHMPEIRILGPTRARAIWAMVDWVEAPTANGDFAQPGQRGFIGYGHYLEEYRKENGVWKIASIRLSRLRVDPIFGEGKLPPQDMTNSRRCPTGWKGL